MNLETHARVLDFETLFSDELIKDPLDPLRGGAGPFNDTLSIHADPVHHNNDSRIVHDPDHPRKDSLKPFPEALKVERLLEAGDLHDRAAVEEEFVNLRALVTLGVRQANAQFFSIDAGEGAHVSLSLTGQNAHVLLEKVG